MALNPIELLIPYRAAWYWRCLPNPCIQCCSLGKRKIADASVACLSISGTISIVATISCAALTQSNPLAYVLIGAGAFVGTVNYCAAGYLYLSRPPVITREDQEAARNLLDQYDASVSDIGSLASDIATTAAAASEQTEGLIAVAVENTGSSNAVAADLRARTCMVALRGSVQDATLKALAAAIGAPVSVPKQEDAGLPQISL